MPAPPVQRPLAGAATSWIFESRDEVFHGGTYTANPLVLAGIDAALDILINDRERVYGHL